jgi:hypothetical protein
VEIALGKQKHLQKLPKEVIATVQNFAKKRNSGLHAILRMFFPYYYIHTYIYPCEVLANLCCEVSMQF